MSREATQRSATYWSGQEAWQIGRGLYWLELEAVQRRLNLKVSGSPDVDWLQYTLYTYLRDQLPVERCLSLGCGKGGLERSLARLNAFVTCDAYDIAEGSIAIAREAARNEGYCHIHYEVRDINYIVLPERTYDVIWVLGAMHHFERLEHVCQQMVQALKAEGILVLNEYVGPSRFQFSQRQREIIQATLRLLPLRYRRLTPVSIEAARSQTLRRSRNIRWLLKRFVDKVKDRSLLSAIQRKFRLLCPTIRKEPLYKTSVAFPSVYDVKAADPSEAVRSAEILPILQRYFDINELKPLGGGLLQFLLEGIAANFNADGDEERILLHLLFDIEDSLMACEDLPSDFVYIVARPKGS